MDSIDYGSHHEDVNGGGQLKLSFIVDAMLGDVARWLRLLGYDTLYAKGLNDPEITRIALREHRILITRDRGLYIFAKRRGVRSILLGDDENMAVKLARIARLTGISLVIDPSRSRCPVCNGELVRITNKELIRDRVPRAVYEHYNEFWVCKRCGRVYWYGSHWRSIERIIREAKRMLEETSYTYTR